MKSTGSESNKRELELEISRLLELNALLREQHMRDVAERDKTIRRLQRELMLQTHEARHHPENELEFMYLGIGCCMCCGRVLLQNRGRICQSWP